MYKHIVKINNRILYVNSIRASGDWIIFERSDGIRYMVHWVDAQYAVCRWLADAITQRECFDFDAIRGIDLKPSFVKRREENESAK